MSKVISKSGQMDTFFNVSKYNYDTSQCMQIAKNHKNVLFEIPNTKIKLDFPKKPDSLFKSLKESKRGLKKQFWSRQLWFKEHSF